MELETGGLIGIWGLGSGFTRQGTRKAPGRRKRKVENRNKAQKSRQVPALLSRERREESLRI